MRQRQRWQSLLAPRHAPDLLTVLFSSLDLCVVLLMCA